jgi:hypothetical protein
VIALLRIFAALTLGCVALLSLPALAADEASGSVPAAPADDTVDLPSFDFTAAFVAPGEDGVLKAEETGLFRVELQNLVSRPFKGVRVSYLALNPIEGLSAASAVVLPELGVGERKTVDLVLVADRAMPSGAAEYVIEVGAQDGAYGPPTRVSFRTRAFIAPKLEVMAIEQQKVGDRVVVKAQLQNSGGPAYDVTARFETAEPGVVVSAPSAVVLGEIAPGEVRALAAEVAVTHDQAKAEVPLWLAVTERHPDLGIRMRILVTLRENETLTKAASPSPP